MGKPPWPSLNTASNGYYFEIELIFLDKMFIRNSFIFLNQYKFSTRSSIIWEIKMLFSIKNCSISCERGGNYVSYLKITFFYRFVCKSNKDIFVGLKTTCILIYFHSIVFLTEFIALYLRVIIFWLQYMYEWCPRKTHLILFLFFNTKQTTIKVIYNVIKITIIIRITNIRSTMKFSQN